MSTLKEGWIHKCGGQIKTWKKRWMVLKGNTLYYYAKQGDKKPKGTIELNSSMKVRDAACKRSPVAFSIQTEGRDYIMYPESKSKEDCIAWQKIISSVINPTQQNAPSSPKSTPTQTPTNTNSTPTTPPPNNSNGGGETAVSKEAKSLVERLNFSKDIVPFLRQGADNQMCEFWNLWYNTVNQQLREDGECDIQFNFSYSSTFNKLFWNSAGPQYLMIQQLVDFFYIVGAPEEEIEKLNIVGEKINPDRIGSWINVSQDGGIDGGWCFTFVVDIRQALKSVEEGQSVDNLLSWCEKHGVEECYYLARDMGAEPPRQTEVRINVPNKGNMLEVVLDAYDMCAFPHPPQEAINVIKQAKNLNLSINITEEDFVRISVIIPDPSVEVVQQFVGKDLDQIQRGLGKVCGLEFQYLKEDFGYSVYQEGYDVHVNYKIH